MGEARWDGADGARHGQLSGRRGTLLRNFVSRFRRPCIACNSFAFRFWSAAPIKNESRRIGSPNPQPCILRLRRALISLPLTPHSLTTAQQQRPLEATVTPLVCCTSLSRAPTPTASYRVAHLSTRSLSPSRACGSFTIYELVASLHLVRLLSSALLCSKGSAR